MWSDDVRKYRGGGEGLGLLDGSLMNSFGMGRRIYFGDC